MDARWTSGEHLGLVWSNGLALIAEKMSEEDARTLWEQCHQQLSVGHFLECLLQREAGRLTNLPDFVVLVQQGDGIQLAVRGSAVISLDSDSAASPDQIITGSDVTSWVERSADQASGAQLAIGDSDAGENGLPIVAGVVRAGTLLWRKVSSGQDSKLVQQQRPVSPGSEADTLFDPDDESLGLPDDSVFNSRAVINSDPDKVADVLPGDSLTPSGAAENHQDEPGHSEIAHLPGTRSANSPVRQQTSAIPQAEYPEKSANYSAARSDEDPDSRFHHLWNGQRHPDFPGSGPDSISDAAEGKPAASSDDSALLAEINDHDAMTIASAEESGEADSSPAEPGTVLAVNCPAGHLNPPHRNDCRICHAPLLGATTRVARPALGWLRSPNGERVELASAVIIGRNPRADRIQGLDIPRLLAFPNGHISSNHLEIRLEGWSVLAVDLHSRNGTYLRRRGQPPMRLPDTPTMLMSGDVLDFGHGVQVSFEEIP